MIVRGNLVDLEALSVLDREDGYGNRAPSTIRKHCTPVGTDEETGRQLYDLQASLAILRSLPRRQT